jgi:carbohydrate-binding DOMON domain-containing protein
MNPTLRSILTITAAGTAAGLLCAQAYAAKYEPTHIVIDDPAHDDNGPGSYTYPTDPAYTKGSFDLRRFEILDRGGDVEMRVEVGAPIEDPWNSKSWGGNGFSVQMVQVYIDTDHKVGSGELKALPGINVQFEPASAWEKVVVLSPQPKSRILAEAAQKARAQKQRIVVPKRTWVSGKQIFALVAKQDLGGAPQKGWGYQVVMQSNEGYPDAGDFLSRKVNEYAGQHRFGGGTDYDCDPHVLDILAGSGSGGDDEAQKQHDILSKYKCAPTPAGYKLAIVPMVYPGT